MKSTMALVLTSLLCAQIASAQTTQTTQPKTYHPNLAADEWQYSVTPYVWAMGVSGSISHGAGPNRNVTLNPGSVLSDLKVAGMIVAEARNRHYGLYIDALYGDLGSTASKVVDNTSLNANTKLKLSMVTLAPSFSLYNNESFNLDGLIGARYMWLNANSTITDPSAGVSVNLSNSQNITAAVAGLKGRWNLGHSNYFVPFYVDVGGGQSSSFTTQAYAGIGRAFEWGDISLVAKNVYYRFKPDNSTVDLNLFGAAVAVTFRF